MAVKKLAIIIIIRDSYESLKYAYVNSGSQLVGSNNAEREATE